MGKYHNFPSPLKFPKHCPMWFSMHIGEIFKTVLKGKKNKRRKER